MTEPGTVSRRSFVRTATAMAAGLAWQQQLPAWARSGTSADMRGLRARPGRSFDLSVAPGTHRVEGEIGRSIAINGQVPAPLLRWREGEDVTLRVTNQLAADTSIHWHGLLLPFQMDGVPGVTFPGIKPGETFTYQFPVRQAGTYWYHSHSGLQEQLGHYGPIVIEPADPDPVGFEREYVLVLSDWTFEDPHRLFAKLKKMSDVYNFQQRTVSDLIRQARAQGIGAAFSERKMWGAMRMNATDIADVTGATYTYLLNGHGSADNWTGLFKPGERIRLRIINASAMSIFNVRIPDLPMTVVQADGLNVQPVETDELQIGTAETYDVVVQPSERIAYALIAESNDRSGLVRGTLAPELGMIAPVPALRQRPTLTMKDMAMSHFEKSHFEKSHSEKNHGAMNHSKMGHGSAEPQVPQAHNHERGPGVVGLAENPVNRLSERPLGLEDAPHRVLVYADLKSLLPNPDPRAPARELELHLTSNMERYMWSFDGIKFSEVDGPIVFHKDERLRLTLVNDTMMPHPIHLHGMFFELVPEFEHSQHIGHKARKHTVVVKPGEKLSVDITADAIGDWAFHCHLLYHMHAGMMRVVSVVDSPAPV
ncbi:MAG: copper resistance system multicopper oxidase [Pseudomonadales bacterium]